MALQEGETLTTGFSELSNSEDDDGDDHRRRRDASSSIPPEGGDAAASAADPAPPPPTTTTTRKKTSKRITEFDAVQHLVKGNLGPGCLNIPHAFATTGWILGLLLFGMVALQGIYSMVILVHCKRWLLQDRKERRRRRRREDDEDEEDAGGGDARGPVVERRRRRRRQQPPSPPLRTFMDVARATHGNAGAVAVQVLLFVLQAGVCCVFLSLIATNLHASMPRWDSDLCVFLVTTALLVAVLVRDLRELRWLSLGANCLMVTAILTAAVSAAWVLLIGSENDTDNDNGDENEPVRAKKWTSNPAAIAGFVSSMFYSFEGIGLVMPIENSFVGYGDDDDDDRGDAPGAGTGTDTNPPSGAAGAPDANNNSSNNSINDDDDDEDDREEELRRRAERARIFVSPVLVGAMSTVAFFFLLIGATCGPAFPDIVDGSVTAYLTERSPGNLWYQLVNAGVMVAVYLTFPLQLTPAMEVLEEWFGPGCDPVCCDDPTTTTTTTAADDRRCCLGGGGLRRRRAGPRNGGRHTRIAQRDDDAPEASRRGDDDDGDVFCDEETAVGATAAEAAAASTDDVSSNGYGAIAPPPPTMTTTSASSSASSSSSPERHRRLLLRRSSCFGSSEWIFRRFLVVFGCALVVLTVNDLGLLMSLFGALGNTGLAAMPCLIHWRLMRTGIAPRNPLLAVVDALTVVVSLSVAVVGVAVSVSEIAEKNRNR